MEFDAQDVISGAYKLVLENSPKHKGVKPADEFKSDEGLLFQEYDMLEGIEMFGEEFENVMEVAGYFWALQLYSDFSERNKSNPPEFRVEVGHDYIETNALGSEFVETVIGGLTEARESLEQAGWEPKYVESFNAGSVKGLARTQKGNPFPSPADTE